jgi:hypothetical protein
VIVTTEICVMFCQDLCILFLRDYPDDVKVQELLKDNFDDIVDKVHACASRDQHLKTYQQIQVGFSRSSLNHVGFPRSSLNHTLQSFGSTLVLFIVYHRVNQNLIFSKSNQVELVYDIEESLIFYIIY